MKTLNCTIILVLVNSSPAVAQSTLEIDDVRVSLIHEVRVPARESGVLVELDVCEGTRVNKGDPLGRIDQQLARLESEAAEFQHQIAKMQSENDINLRFARKSREVSVAELERSLQAVRTFPKSVSKTEVDQQRLVAERSALAIEQADVELSVARLTSELRSRESDIADTRLKHRQVVAPLSGIIVEIYPHAGEWIQAGQTILRIIRLDRLRVEAFVDSQRFDDALLGRPAALFVAMPPDDRTSVFEGKIVFVSPEVDPVNGQIRIWAEVDNTEGKLRPGTTGRLQIRLKG